MSYTIDLFVDRISPADETRMEYFHGTNVELPVHNFGGARFAETPIPEYLSRILPPNLVSKLPKCLALSSETVLQWQLGRLDENAARAVPDAIDRILASSAAWAVEIASRRGRGSKVIKCDTGEVVKFITSHFLSDDEQRFDAVFLIPTASTKR
jgi:hypothetical protein